MSLRRRLFVAVVLASALASTLLGWRLTASLRMRFEQASESALVDTAEILAAEVAQASVDGTPAVAALQRAWALARAEPVHALIYEVSKQDLGMDVSITDKTGVVLWDSGRPEDIGSDHSRWRDVARTLQGTYGARATRAQVDDPASAVLHVAAPIRQAGRLIGVLTVSRPVGPSEIFLRQAQLQTVSICAVTALLGGITAALATIWITRPISELTAWVAAARAGHRSPAPQGGPSEIVGLSSAFSALADELEGRKYVEVWAQQLAHEMKSPIAGLQASAELLSGELPAADRDRLLANLRESSQRLASMLDRLLVLASVERLRQRERTERCDLHLLCSQAMEALQPMARQRAVTIQLQGPASVPVQGDQFQLQQAVRNLLQNAIEFSPDGAVVDMAVSVEAGQAQLVIEDRGPGIAVAIKPRLFERFASSAPPHGRKGTGLGLVLVKEVARLHQGTITLSDRAGAGARACLRLPTALTSSTPG